MKVCVERGYVDIKHFYNVIALVVIVSNLNAVIICVVNAYRHTTYIAVLEDTHYTGRDSSIVVRCCVGIENCGKIALGVGKRYVAVFEHGGFIGKSLILSNEEYALVGFVGVVVHKHTVIVLY